MAPADEQRVKPMMAVFKEMFPIIRQALRDKGFGLRTRPNATARFSSNMIIQSPQSGSDIGSVEALGSAAAASISMSAANIMCASSSPGSNFYLAPLTPPGTTVASPMTESQGSVSSPSPPPLTPGGSGSAIPVADVNQMFVDPTLQHLQQLQS
ncbi:hypothetical protein BGZ46_006514, partial [Entomortierella lignicola]